MHEMEWRAGLKEQKSKEQIMDEVDYSSLSRPIQPMPDFVRHVLEVEVLMKAYHSRPPYQQNDYLAWIRRAKRPETQTKRLAQMLEELKQGDVYIKMRYRVK